MKGPMETSGRYCPFHPNSELIPRVRDATITINIKSEEKEEIKRHIDWRHEQIAKVEQDKTKVMFICPQPRCAYGEGY
jgi:hypothetical protein